MEIVKELQRRLQEEEYNIEDSLDNIKHQTGL